MEWKGLLSVVIPACTKVAYSPSGINEPTDEVWFTDSWNTA
jgi:hypothetical protein